MLGIARTCSVLDKIAVLRLAPFAMLLALSACTTAAGTQPGMSFALADPSKYKTDIERQRAQQLAETACKTKAMTASAEFEKTIASEHHSRENLDRAREKAAEMYSTAFALCMMSNGYVKK
jgi:hypothetical protein